MVTLREVELFIFHDPKFLFTGTTMRNVFNGDGTVFPSVPCNGRMRHWGLLGIGRHFISRYCQICSALEIHTISHQHSYYGNYFLHLVRIWRRQPPAPWRNFLSSTYLVPTFAQILHICLTRRARKANLNFPAVNLRINGGANLLNMILWPWLAKISRKIWFAGGLLGGTLHFCFF